ncbi:MAG TPA: hypothetical protein VF066_03335 [Thermoleophilaceae bacterium]
MRGRLPLLILVASLSLPAPAFAGRLIVTGHDADRRCALLDQQCGFLKTTIKYVRETAPRPTKPVLVLDRGAKQLATAMQKAWSTTGSYTGPAVRIVDPRSPTFAKLAIDVKRYSAIAIASDSSCGGCDLEWQDSAAIWKRKAVIQKFLNQGGGIFAGAGGSNAAAYYRFMPVPGAGPGSEGPFHVTAYGRSIGLKPADLAGAVVNTFAPPEVGRMDVAATNANNVGDTLIADGRVRKGKLYADTTIPPAIGQSIVVNPVSGTVLGHPPDDPVFRRIVGAANLVSGWTFDVTKGRVSLTTAANSRGALQTTQAYEGFFTALQSSGSPVTDLVLRSGNFDAICGSGGVDIARASANTKSVRHLWASGSGKFRTKGRFAAAAVRGTEWQTDDRCDGTLITVAKGAVSVFDQVLKKTVVVRAGQTYLAKAAG